MPIVGEFSSFLKFAGWQQAQLVAPDCVAAAAYGAHARRFANGLPYQNLFGIFICAGGRSMDR